MLYYPKEIDNEEKIYSISYFFLIRMLPFTVSYWTYGIARNYFSVVLQDFWLQFQMGLFTI